MINLNYIHVVFFALVSTPSQFQSGMHDHSETLCIGIIIHIAMEFSLEELERATSSFSSLIGEGGFGKVYLGTNIRHSGTSVAVKLLNEVLVYIIVH